MPEQEPASTLPQFSVVIAVYNDWALLGRCLQSLAQQADGASFEVILVDDGSNESAPESIRNWADRYPVSFIRESHAGISAARNLGVRDSKGGVLLFVDADCILQTHCLAALAL